MELDHVNFKEFFIVGRTKCAVEYLPPVTSRSREHPSTRMMYRNMLEGISKKLLLYLL